MKRIFFIIPMAVALLTSSVMASPRSDLREAIYQIREANHIIQDQEDELDYFDALIAREHLRDARRELHSYKSDRRIEEADELIDELRDFLRYSAFRELRYIQRRMEYDSDEAIYLIRRSETYRDNDYDDDYDDDKDDHIRSLKIGEFVKGNSSPYSFQPIISSHTRRSSFRDVIVKVSACDSRTPIVNTIRVWGPGGSPEYHVGQYLEQGSNRMSQRVREGRISIPQNASRIRINFDQGRNCRIQVYLAN